MAPRDTEEEVRRLRSCLEKAQATHGRNLSEDVVGCKEEMKTWRQDLWLEFRHYEHSAEDVSRQSEIQYWHISKKSELELKKLFGVVFQTKAELSLPLRG